MNKRRLGRGLEALLGREEGGFEPGSLEATELLHVAVDQIDPNPFQPRRHFDPAEIAALADSLRQHGMLQPILVRAVGDRYQLIAGERRLRASIEAQLHEIPARVMDLDDQRVFELAMVENLQREDLNAVDKATAFRDYLAPLRRHPGGARRPARARPLDRLEPDPPARPARRRSRTPSATPRSPRDTPAPCSACPTRRASAPPAGGSSPRTSRSARPRPSSPPAIPTPGPAPDPPRPGPCARSPSRPTSSSSSSTSTSGSGPSVLIRARTPDRGQIIIDYNSQEEFDRVSSLIRGGSGVPRFVNLRAVVSSARATVSGPGGATGVPPTARPENLSQPSLTSGTGSATRLPLFAVRGSLFENLGDKVARSCLVPTPLMILVKSILSRRVGAILRHTRLVAPGLH